MPRYGAVWLEIARERYASLPADIQDLIDAEVAELLEDPRQPRSAYDQRTDQWTTTYGEGAGLLLLATSVEYQTVIVLRLVHLP